MNISQTFLIISYHQLHWLFLHCQSFECLNALYIFSEQYRKQGQIYYEKCLGKSEAEPDKGTDGFLKMIELQKPKKPRGWCYSKNILSNSVKYSTSVNKHVIPTDSRVQYTQLQHHLSNKYEVENAKQQSSHCLYKHHFSTRWL